MKIAKAQEWFKAHYFAWWRFSEEYTDSEIQEGYEAAWERGLIFKDCSQESHRRCSGSNEFRNGLTGHREYPIRLPVFANACGVPLPAAEDAAQLGDDDRGAAGLCPCVEPADSLLRLPLTLGHAVL